MSYLSAQKVTVCALNAKVNSNQTCSIELTLQVANKQELDWVIKQIAKRQDTIEIFRVMNECERNTCHETGRYRGCLNQASRWKAEKSDAIGKGFMVLCGVEDGDTAGGCPLLCG